MTEVSRREFRGHVYNLQTRDGWYAANGIIAHNCRHEYGLYLPGVTDRPDRPPKEERSERYENRQRQREIERRIREWKRREAAAGEIDEGRARQARAKVREWQARARAQADEPGGKRQYAREQLGAR